jgi:hypothetical protein
MRNHNIGSVSSGTMRAEDLIPAFLSELRFQKPLRREHRKLVREITQRMDADYTHDHEAEGCKCNGLGLWNCGMNQDAENYFGTENADYDLESLFDALNEYAPAYFYFGAHPGDGSDYGYWLSEGFAEDFDGMKVSDLSEVPTGFSGEVLNVNDHGNMTLYAYSRGRGREVWGIV